MLLRLGDYQILQRVGDSFVYRAQDTRNERVVALKVLPAWKHSSEALTRFEREVKVESSIEHPNLARFYELGRERVNDPELVGSAGDTSGAAHVFFFSREWIDGRSVDALLKGHRPPLALSISIAIQAAEGLGALHAHDVVHRNIHPSTVYLADDNMVKLVDFGLVKILKEEASGDRAYQTSVTQMIGTAGYIAPEQFRGQPVDARSDLFAIGVLLYEMIAGRRPFPTEELLQYFRALEKDEPPDLSELAPAVPKELARIAGKLVARDPDRRYQSAAELARELSAVLGSPAI